MNPVDRLHALDAVRAYALLLGIVLHAAAAFVAGFPIPNWVDTPSNGAAVMYYVIHMFRMSAFFLIAGFFARMVVERRGVKSFVRDRAKRIAVPLFLGWPLIFAFIAVGAVLGALVHGMDYFRSLAAVSAPQTDAQAAGGGAAINTAHLWFLYYLLIFYALALVLRSAVHRLDPNRRLAAFADRLVTFTMSGIQAPVIVAVPLVWYFLQFESWNEWIGLPAPFDLIPRADAIVGYGVAFSLGWMLHRQIPLLLDLRRFWLAYLALAIGLTVTCLWIIGVSPTWQPANLAGSERVVYTIAYMVGLWCWVFAFVGAALRFLSHESPLNRYLADASYFVYLMHLGTVIFFVTALRPLPWHWSIKLTITVAGSVPILLFMYHYLARFTWIGAILNGRRHPRAGRPPPGKAATAG